jgi:hypothetical protein
LQHKQDFQNVGYDEVIRKSYNHRLHHYGAEIRTESDNFGDISHLGSTTHSDGTNLYHSRPAQHSSIHQIPESLQSSFSPKEYAEMETALVDAIIQLRQIATPPTTTTTATPTYQTKDERIHGILQAFVNKNLNSAAEEREEKKQALRLTKQQEQIYATE